MQNNWIVSKFGGSSVKDGTAMLRSSYIVENNPNIKLAIISATYNTTNQLELVANTALTSDQEILEKVILEIENKHKNIAQELFSSNVVYEELKNLNEEMRKISNEILSSKTLTAMQMDQLYSIGERMSSLIFADLLKLRIPKRNVIFIDAREIIKTNSEFKKAEPQVELISENAKNKLMPILSDPNSLIVTQGFIGSDLIGNTTTLGREGSDYSAALFGEAINASLIQIWTDVEGIAECDPRMIKEAKYIERLSYDEATALAMNGAKVLFPRTLLPAKRKNIPVFVGSSLRPDTMGTMIDASSDDHCRLKAIAAQNNNGRFELTFVGSHLEKNVELLNKLKDLLINKHHSFTFIDYTAVSITFSFNELSIQDALSIGHSVLLSFK